MQTYLVTVKQIIYEKVTVVVQADSKGKAKGIGEEKSSNVPSEFWEPYAVKSCNDETIVVMKCDDDED